jgi:hypothetical protein
MGRARKPSPAPKAISTPAVNNLLLFKGALVHATKEHSTDTVPSEMSEVSAENRRDGSDHNPKPGVIVIFPKKTKQIALPATGSDLA